MSNAAVELFIMITVATSINQNNIMVIHLNYKVYSQSGFYNACSVIFTYKITIDVQGIDCESKLINALIK